LAKASWLDSMSFSPGFLPEKIHRDFLKID